MVRDLNYDSAAFLFSWPSLGDFLRYGSDRRTANEANDALAAFLLGVAGATGAEKVHILPHSMGNRVLLAGLEQVVALEGGVPPELGEVIFAAPAVPATEFRERLGRF